MILQYTARERVKTTWHVFQKKKNTWKSFVEFQIESLEQTRLSTMLEIM